MRPELVEATRFPEPDPKSMTMGQAAQWANSLRRFDPYSVEEAALVTEQWVVLINAIADREGLMPGMLAYIIDEIAFTERISIPKEGQDDEETS